MYYIYTIHIVTFLPFKNVYIYMSSLIANQVKKICRCSHLTDTTLIITISACSTQLFVILLTTATLC